MRVVAPQEVTDFVQQRGGRLFVWPDRVRCCGSALTLLRSSTDPPPRPGEFRRVDAGGFQLWLHPSMRRLPDEMELSLRGRRRRHVEAYWDGCVYAI